jgi:hypothetical protein
MEALIMCNNCELSKKRFILLVILIVVSSASILTAQLPSTVSSRVTKIEAAIVAIEQALSKNQLSTAQRRLGEINVIMKEINDRYKGTFEENDPVYVAMTTRLSVVMKAIADAENPTGTTKEGEEAAKVEIVAPLPSAVASRVKNIEAALVVIEQALNNNQLTTAQRRLVDANKILKEINDRYKGTFSENDPEYSAMIVRFNAATKGIADAEELARLAKEAEEAAKRAKEEQSARWIQRFAPFLEAKGEKDLPIGSGLNYLPEDKQAIAKASAREAQILFDEYKNTQFPNGKTFDLESIASTLADRLKYYADLAQSDVKEVSCAPWVDLLSPYVEVGRGSPKYLVLSVTMDFSEILASETNYKEAKEAFEAYKKADFPHGKTYRLEQIEKLFEQALLEMPGYLAESRKKISDEVERRIDNVINYFETTTAWKSDEKAVPPIIMAIDFASLKEGVEDYASKAVKGDAKVAVLRSKLQKIQDMDKANRVIWGQRNFQLRDAYKGNDIAQLKETASLAALKDYPNAKIFHVTVTSEDWAIEDVVEFTDTTKTAIARRITRSVRTQVSLKTTSGEVRLLGIYLGQNKAPDGSWQRLVGHSTWEDPIAEANIGKFVDKK